MTAETDLSTLIRVMKPSLRDGVFVFVNVPHGAPPPDGFTPLMTFREDEGLTLVMTRDQAIASSLAFSTPSRMITLNVYSALDAVGFLAAVTGRLAAAGIPVNSVSAFHHDHLFIPEARAEEALGILNELSREPGRSL